jgi:hypothetical protein
MIRRIETFNLKTIILDVRTFTAGLLTKDRAQPKDDRSNDSLEDFKLGSKESILYLYQTF